jgi:hypothetical protein
MGAAYMQENGYVKAVRDTALYLYFNIKQSIKDDRQAKLVTAEILNGIAEEYKTEAQKDKD